jgi:hypothetical protein
MSLTNAGEELLLAWMLTTTSVTRPVDWEMSLHTADPGEAGTANEVSTGVDADYVRKDLTFDDPVANSGQVLSDVAATWTADAGATTHTVTHAVIWDKTNAVPLISGQLLVPRTIVASAVTTFAIGDVIANLD